MSITLEEVASCRLETRSHPILLVAAFLTAAMGLWTLTASDGDLGGVAMTLFVLAVVQMIVYFIARRGFLVISSAGEPIAIETKGMSRERQVGFIEALEHAKLTRGRQG